MKKIRKIRKRAVKIIRALKYAAEHECSNIHITQDRPFALRSNGVILKEGTYDITIDNITRFIKSVVTHKYDEFIENSYSDIDASFETFGRRFKANIYKSSKGVSIAIRLINNKVPTLDSLSLPTDISNFCDMKNGLVLVAGTAGSGKTSTLAGMVERINQTSAVNILTIEDPIEFVYKEQSARIVQREIGTHVKGFADATKIAMHQDADVVVIDELQDLDTISNAMSIAETGQLVIAAIQSNSMTDTIDHILDVFPHEKQSRMRMRLASVLRGLVYQKRGSNFTDARPVAEVFTDDTLAGMIMQNGKSHEKFYQAR